MQLCWAILRPEEVHSCGWKLVCFQTNVLFWRMLQLLHGKSTEWEIYTKALHLICIYVKCSLCLYNDSLTYIQSILIYKILKLKHVNSSQALTKKLLFNSEEFLKRKKKITEIQNCCCDQVWIWFVQVNIFSYI